MNTDKAGKRDANCANVRELIGVIRGNSRNSRPSLFSIRVHPSRKAGSVVNMSSSAVRLSFNGLFLRKRGNKSVPIHDRFDALDVRRTAGIDDLRHVFEEFRTNQSWRHNRERFGSFLPQVVEPMHRAARNETRLTGTDVHGLAT